MNIAPQVTVTINGKEITAPSSLSTIQALWYAGYPRVQSVGCLEGVCGSCRILLRRANSSEVTMALGCQTLLEEGMEVNFLVFPTPTHHTYNLEEIPNSWEVQTQFHQIFPESRQSFFNKLTGRTVFLTQLNTGHTSGDTGFDNFKSGSSFRKATVGYKVQRIID